MIDRKLGQTKRPLQPHAVRDVTTRLDDVADLARFIENRRRGDLDEELLALGVVVRVRHRYGGFGGDDLTERAWLVLPRAWQVAMVRELMAGQANRWVDSAGHLAGGTIGQDDAVVGANDQQDVGDGVNNCLQEGPRLPDRLLHILALGDIVDGRLAKGVFSSWQCSLCVRWRWFLLPAISDLKRSLWLTHLPLNLAGWRYASRFVPLPGHLRGVPRWAMPLPSYIARGYPSIRRCNCPQGRHECRPAMISIAININCLICGLLIDKPAGLD